MKDGLIFGLLIGAAIGMILMETYKPVQDVMEQGKQKVKQTVAKM